MQLSAAIFALNERLEIKMVVFALLKLAFWYSLSSRGWVIRHGIDSNCFTWNVLETFHTICITDRIGTGLI